MFDAYIFNDGFNYQIGSLYRFSQIWRPIDSIQCFSNKLFLFKLVVFEIFFSNSNQAIFNAITSLFHQAVINFNDGDIISSNGSDLSHFNIG